MHLCIEVTHDNSFNAVQYTFTSTIFEVFEVTVMSQVVFEEGRIGRILDGTGFNSIPTLIRSVLSTASGVWNS